tara:strand:- start:5525 stop:6106 length:582 start_codon:yes stop_codon:yes gene_type:complete
MLLINHRVNTISQLLATPQEVGVEVDLRTFDEEIVLHHDPFVKGENFNDFIKHFKHAFIILNIKCEGIEKRVIEIVEAQGIKDYFLLDVTPPFMFKLIKDGVSKLAVRFSEFESISTCMNLKGKVDWVFVDNLTRLPYENNAFSALREHFKLCIVSPELLNRNEIPMTKEILVNNPVDAVLTHNLDGWMGDQD